MYVLPAMCNIIVSLTHEAFRNARRDVAAFVGRRLKILFVFDIYITCTETKHRIMLSISTSFFLSAIFLLKRKSRYLNITYGFAHRDTW